MWDRVWLPGHPPLGGADVLSPYPYDVVVDMNGYVALVVREYEPDRIIKVMDELLGNNFVVADEFPVAPDFVNHHLKLFSKGGLKLIEIQSEGKVVEFTLFDVRGHRTKLDQLKNGLYSAADTASGIYFYRYNINGNSIEGKILFP